MINKDLGLVELMINKDLGLVELMVNKDLGLVELMVNKDLGLVYRRNFWPLLKTYIKDSRMTKTLIPYISTTPNPSINRPHAVFAPILELQVLL